MRLARRLAPNFMKSSSYAQDVFIDQAKQIMTGRIMFFSDQEGSKEIYALIRDNKKLFEGYSIDVI